MNREKLHPIAMIATWAVLMLAAVGQAQGADQATKEGYAQSSPVMEKSVTQETGTPTSGSGEPVPRLPDPSVFRKVTVQPTVTGVFPYLVSPGKKYTLILQGQALTQQMVLDFGPGIITIGGSVKIGTGPEEFAASVVVLVAPNAVPGMRTVRLASAPGQPWKAQSAKLAVFVEPASKNEGPIKATPLN